MVKYIGPALIVAIGIAAGLLWKMPPIASPHSPPCGLVAGDLVTVKGGTHIFVVTSPGEHNGAWIMNSDTLQSIGLGDCSILRRAQ